MHQQGANIDERIDEILTRGVGTFVDPEGRFRKKLREKATGEYKGEVIVKFGVDPTRPDIHLGHAVVLRKLRQMQDLGCRIIFLVGDFTAMIGDPTGKSKVRPELDQEEVEKNVKTYLDQIGKILLLDEKVFSWIRNSDWFYSVTDISTAGASSQALTWNTTDASGQQVHINVEPNSFVGKALLFEHTRMQRSVLRRNDIRGVSIVNLLSVLRLVSHGQLIERDMFQDRLKDGAPLFMHEMLYPVIQGIDSNLIADVYGSCDLEVGGTDQTFNMLMGRKVMEATKREPQAVLAFELLVGLDGKEKMSKSLDNYIGITDAPSDMYGKVMSMPDSAITTFAELCTYTPLSEVSRLAKDLEGGRVHPKDAKMNIALQIVEIYHGALEAGKAEENFVHTFQKHKVPQDIDTIAVAAGTPLVEALCAHGIVASKTEFRRLLDDGALRRNGETKITDREFAITEDVIIKVGKHRFVAFAVKE